jgi:cyclophilin family peptidyl-prolyl cis-trans isomerase
LRSSSFDLRALGLTLVLAVLTGASPRPDSSTSAAPEPEPPPASRELPPGEPVAPAPDSIPALDAVVVVQKFGEFRIRFYREDVPNHVAHFLALAANGFYDGMSFHRVVPGLLIQTGDPASRDEDRWNDGFGAPPYRLPPERSDRTHRAGTVSMAWQPDAPGASGSQWFVSLGELPQLDGHGTPIGEVVEGMDTVNRISQVTTLRNWNPLGRVVIEKVRLVDALAPQSEAADSGDPVESLAE